MANFNWTGVISKGIMKLKLAFTPDVSIPERMEIMSSYAQSLSSSKGVSIIESHHYADSSSMRAVINQ